jgi:tRNA(Ile)-lysidine synthase
MKLLEKFTKNIQENFPFLSKNRFFIAVSGGLDSMVLVHLFQHFKFSFGLLHCNFKLRGEESEADMQFIHQYADENRLKLLIGFFETEAVANELKVSIQVAARELRYNWFYEQMQEHNANYVATAHHLDDNLETFLINLSRGTGLDGLTGIPAKNDKIIRPLLPFSREEIENYAKEHDIKWREDSSNASDKYLRNKIRHHIVPLLKEINLNFLDAFQKTQNHLQDAQTLVTDADYFIYREVAKETPDGLIYFDLKLLLQIPNYRAYLYQWLKQFEFTAWDDVYNLVNAQTGKQVFSKSYKLLKNRDTLVLSINEDDFFEPVIIQNLLSKVDFPLKLSFQEELNNANNSKNVIFVDYNKLDFPLTIRKWNEGDVFHPLGMKGSKKVSKFFKDEKLSLFEKENTFILESDDKIVWIINHRADNRFVNSDKTKNNIKIEFLNNNEDNI